ncbi:FmdB family zinc ribbon protein [Rubrivivax gelatinosus]|uniref:Putative FmdB family regulatory protein n=1 Tax=Rubrivivax gelatinosus TaxID=28068 RepID=A0A4R2MC66_RUBGE|nr:zinc ribbon domain-containing protein [Rubrivivax gelatinosus]MBK1686440.1 FmdB family transcriptional regulator [Rubrivivax gelatinosus]TCP04332.1 putative FmdB family regulatory protein [Rubrivivax gelatinosus]
MPIYEYACQECSQRFEALVRSDTVVQCPQCHSTLLEKQLSVFAAGRTAPEAPPTPVNPCAGCGRAAGPGSCSLR